jgi:hypothetical protein
MWVEAILTKDDLATLLVDLCPLTIALDQTGRGEHYLRLLNPKDVALVEGRGLRVTCEAELHWPVLGIDAPMRAESLTMLLNVGLSPAVDGELLSFKPEIESLDVAWVPNLFDGRITDKLNHELGERHVELSWHFFQTLSHVFELPGVLHPATALDLRVGWGKVRVTDEAMVMAVSFNTHVLQSPASDRMVEPRPASVPATRTLAPPPARGVSVPLPVAVAGAAALLGVAVYAAFGATQRLWR